MLGLMQDVPLNIPSLVRHAEKLHSKKLVVTNTPEGIQTATLGEVILRSRKLAGALRALGIRDCERVATLSWNHQRHFEVYIAASAMGAVLHTLNLRLFPDDLAYIVDHAEDRVVVVDKSLWPLWEKVASKVKSVRTVVLVNDCAGPVPPGTIDYDELVEGGKEIEFPLDVPEHQAASMCYTSGTTGHPKGVLYSHRSTVLHSFCAAQVDSLAVSERDVVILIAPMFHANAWGLPFACLMTGSEIVLPGRMMTPEALVGLIIDRKVTCGGAVPTLLQGMLSPLIAAKAELKSLKQLLCGGSALPLALQEAYRNQLGVNVIHAWGMTETSPIGSIARPIAAHEGASEEKLASVRNSQGRPPYGVMLRIMDDAGNELPWDGASVGELEARGNWISSGYYNDDTSRARFDGGWLKTGDVASIDSEGYVRIADRTKDLVKSGGEWISSIEIESHVMAHPDVAEAAVIAVAHPKWQERPLACVVPKPDAKGRLDKSAILEYLRPKIAKWWLPDDVVFIDQIPKTSVGKFDKKALRARFADYKLPTA